MNKKMILVAAAALLTLAGCGVDPERARSALEAQGLSDVQIGGHSWFGCDEKDTYSSTFTATGANGKPVKGVVCSGFFKGVTIRYD